MSFPFLLRPALLCTAFYVALTPASHAAEDALNLRHVVLSSSGLGQYIFQADVKNNATLTLPVRREQVNDILKSLVVLDNKGTVGAVTLPGDEGLSTLFRSLPFKQNAFESLTEFLTATRGQTIRVEGSVKATGKIMTLTPVITRSPDGTETTRYTLSLLTSDGLRQIPLEQVSLLSYQDTKLNDALARAMQGFAAQTNDDQRRIAIALRGDTSRRVGISYTIEAPVWKVAYRLRLAPSNTAPSNKEAKKEDGYLQAWAIVENSSAEDWKDVQLTLTSGSPVTYQQALYPSYFVQRPILPLPIPNMARPRIDHGVLQTMQDSVGMAPPAPGSARMKTAQRAIGAAVPMMAAHPESLYEAADTMAANSQFATGQQTPLLQQQTTQMSLTFPNPISVASGSSLMVPFWASNITGDVHYLYQPDTHAQHPYASVAIHNTGTNTLPPGIVTLYQAADESKPSQFVGDAEMPTIPAGENRLVPFALDQDTKIDRRIDHQQNITKISAAKGVLTMQSVQEQKNSYTVRAPKNAARVIVIEEPKRQGWELITPDAKSVEETATHYRIKKSVAKNETLRFDTVQHYRNEERVTLTHLGRDGILSYLNRGGAISKDAKKALEEAAEKRRAVDALDQKLARAEATKKSLYDEQERLRKNLKAVPENSDLAKRYLKTLEDQENTLQTIDKEIEKLRDERAKAWNIFTDGVTDLTF